MNTMAWTYLIDGSVQVNGGRALTVHADDVAASLDEVSCKQKL